VPMVRSGLKRDLRTLQGVLDQRPAASTRS
jgi:hypothetical protein